jgi:fructoselysine 6-kinase
MDLNNQTERDVIMKKVLALSCCCVDFFPEKNIINVGGNALNVAVSCVKTGKADVSLMGNVGKDDYAEEIIKTADKYKINRSRLYTVDGITANNKIYLTNEGEKYEKPDSWTNGVYVKFRLSDEDVEYMKTFDAVASTVNDPNFKHTLGVRRNAGFLLSMDFLDHAPLDDWENYFPAIDLFFISGKDEYSPLLKKWSDKYNTVFVSTLGAYGSIAYKCGVKYSCEAVKVEKVVDTTGCGDSYQGAFIVDYLMNGDILSAMKAGSQSAAVTLSHVGAFQ